MKELQETYGEDGFQILGVASDDAESLQAYYKKAGDLPWPNIVDADDAISGKVGIDAFPTYFLIDREGNHVATPWDKDEVAALLPALLEGRDLNEAVVELELEDGLEDDIEGDIEDLVVPDGE